MNTEAVWGTAPARCHGAFQALGTEERERDNKVDIWALDDALNARVGAAGEVDCRWLDLESQSHVNRK